MSGEIEKAHQRLTKRVISRKGVTGTAIGLTGGKPCIKVYVNRRSDAATSRIPSSFEGFRVIVEETGTIHRLGT